MGAVSSGDDDLHAFVLGCLFIGGIQLVEELGVLCIARVGAVEHNSRDMLGGLFVKDVIPGHFTLPCCRAGAYHRTPHDDTRNRKMPLSASAVQTAKVRNSVWSGGPEAMCSSGAPSRNSKMQQAKVKPIGISSPPVPPPRETG